MGNLRYTAMCSPRPAYLADVEADPKGIGFAYGGVYPGRLHATEVGDCDFQQLAESAPICGEALSGSAPHAWTS